MEMLNVELIESGKRMTVPDVKPLPSASLYLDTSNELWRRKNQANMLSLVRIESVVPPLQARTEMNGALEAIAPQLALDGLKQAVSLNDPYSNEAVLFEPDFFNAPAYAGVETFNWDYSGKYRRMEIDGVVEAVEFTDGHLDYQRELGAQFHYEQDGKFVSVSHAIHRSQSWQDQPATVSTNVWYSEFAETGYEGSIIAHAEMTVEQEAAVVLAIRRMAGLAIDAAASEA